MPITEGYYSTLNPGNGAWQYYGTLFREGGALMMDTTFEAGNGAVTFFGPIAKYYVAQTDGGGDAYTYFVFRLADDGGVEAADLSLGKIMAATQFEVLTGHPPGLNDGVDEFSVVRLAGDAQANWQIIEKALTEHGGEISQYQPLRLTGLPLRYPAAASDCDQDRPTLYADRYLLGDASCQFNNIEPTGARSFSISATCTGGGGVAEQASMTVTIADTGTASFDAVWGARMAAYAQSQQVTLPLELSKVCYQGTPYEEGNLFVPSK